MNGVHPSKDIVGSRGNILADKTICICVTGSVAAIKTPELCRSLMRLGAEIITVMTPSAMKIIHPDLLYWSTGNPVITELTGATEHIAIAGERPGKKGKADLVVVAPATANTISKIACGIDDTPVTTVCTTAIGSGTPIIIVPAMHSSMYNHPILKENMEKLERLGIDIIRPVVSENKAKIPPVDKIVSFIVDKLITEKDLKGMNFLVTAGPTREYIDRVRFISNPSSGKMGMEIAAEIIARGGKVTVVHGPCTVDPPPGAEVYPVTSAVEMFDTVTGLIKERKYDVFISAAAVADYTPVEKVEDKLGSLKESLVINLRPTPKIIDAVRNNDPDIFIVAFKAETNLFGEKLIEKAYSRLKTAKADLIVANNVYGSKYTGFGCDTNEVYIIDKNKNVKHVALCSKREVAHEILDYVLSKLKPDN